MLNLEDQSLQKLITAPMSAKEARQAVTKAYKARINAMRNDALWQANLPAMAATIRSYTTLLADKLLAALRGDKHLDKDFAARLWYEVSVGDADRSTITLYLAGTSSNQELLTIDGPFTKEAKLVAKNLPTLLQVTAEDPTLDYTDAEVTALIALIKCLYTADLAFTSIDETVLQPVDGLHFKTRYTTVRTLNVTKTVADGSATLTVPLTNAAVATYQVLDDHKRDWADAGTDSQDAQGFSWTTSTLPEELEGQNLKLVAQVRTGENSPALDELFVIASANAILMRQGQPGDYSLDLPNHAQLAIKVDPDSDALTLRYPEPTRQLIELNHTYPFIGEWLKAILPMRRAFN
ncbi:hypothetical protein [Lacticaseibacillus kribbianus]|uniref:hypothetical protein n=1 Tax=Lacticaseibacillus kribbianus TaxID=2926292 RepID=UPI001CD576F4|nr:hypothetical protein [Lacticaseibacillus kribbianus]